MNGLSLGEKVRDSYAEGMANSHGCMKMTFFSENVCFSTTRWVNRVHEAVKVDFVFMFKSGH